MIVYYLIPTLLIFSYLISLRNNRIYDLFFSLIVISALIVFVGFRFNSDRDYNDYHLMFTSVPMLDDFSYDNIKHMHGEIGYLFINSLIKSVGFDFYVVTLLFSFLSLFTKYCFFRSYLTCGSLALFLYLSLSFINIEFITIRWAASCGFICVGIHYLIQEKKRLFILSFLLASIFHYYSIVFFILAVLSRIKIRNWMYFSAFFVVVMLVFWVDISKFIEMLTSVNSSNVLVFRLIRYMTSDDFHVPIGMLSKLKLIYYVLIVYSFYILERRLFYVPIVNKLFSIMMLIGIFSVVMLYFPIFFFRSVVMFDILSIILILILFQHSKKLGKKAHIYKFVFVFSLLIWCVLDIGIKYKSGVIMDYTSSIV